MNPLNFKDSFSEAQYRPLRVAIIGSGIAGLSAAWLLNQSPDRFSVTLFEREPRLGGHTHTVLVPPLPNFIRNSQDVQPIPVDTGFAVCNPVTYPNFLSLLGALNIPLAQSSVGFSVSRDRGKFEWCGEKISSLFVPLKSLFDFSQDGIWIMLWDILRFHWHAYSIAKAMDQLILGIHEEDGIPPSHFITRIF
jgi:predicted NAD/FAD-binding protein